MKHEHETKCKPLKNTKLWIHDFMKYFVRKESLMENWILGENASVFWDLEPYCGPSVKAYRIYSNKGLGVY